MLPGPGTAAEIGAALGDITLLTAAQVELILLAAHLYGRPLTDQDARLLDVLLVLGLDVGAVKLQPRRRGRGDGRVAPRPTSCAARGPTRSPRRSRVGWRCR